MVVVLRLTVERLDRLAWRLVRGRRFTTTVPERTIILPRTGCLCLLMADRQVIEDQLDDPHPDWDATPEPRVIGLARIKSSPRPSTTDDRVHVSDPVLIRGTSLQELLRTTPAPGVRRALRQASRRVATDLSEHGDAVVSALLELRPEISDIVAQLRRADEVEPVTDERAPVLSLEGDAVRLALSFAGLDLEPTTAWEEGGDGSFLSGLAYQPNEDSLLAHDATRFPQWTPLPGERSDWVTFTDGVQHMRIGNVNRTPLEQVLGVDLMYRHLEADTFVLVQYKRMRREGRSWFYRPDKQLERELARMRRVDSVPVPAEASAATWRLHPRSMYLKLVREPGQFDPRSQNLLSGLYLPLMYFDELMRSDTTLGPKGGRRFGYETVDRYITSALFVKLVREGWVGTRGVATTAISELVRRAVDNGRSVMVAEERGTASPGERRRTRPRR